MTTPSPVATLSLTMAAEPLHDVVIAGGGLAGQCLARQLLMARPELSVALVDFERRPLPEAAFKVGEATSELGAHYLSVKLGLKSYLEREHLLKNGLRFFFGDPHRPLADRPEYGPRDFPPVTSFQLDRGRLENHLRELNQSAGVHLFEGFRVSNVVLGRKGEPHRTLIQERDSGRNETLQSAWLVDCTGRRRTLQHQLNLGAVSPLRHGAVWFRIRGQCHVDSFVPRDHRTWHERVPQGIRHRSTTHFVGHGYWVWLIPLSSRNTSVGIVTDERTHPVSELDSYDKALAWLQRHEPAVAREVVGFNVMDFLVLPHFSYDTTKFYSTDRWACVGEAASFLDPFYSPGSDFIAMGNTMVTRLVLRDLQDNLAPEAVEQSDATMLMLQRAFTEVFRDQYHVFGHAGPMTAKVLWDNSSYWVFVCQAFFQDIFFDDDYLDRYRLEFERFYRLNLKVQQLFRDWATLSRAATHYDYLGYADFPIAVRSHLELATQKTPRRFLEWLEVNLDRFTAWAIVLFLIAAEDINPPLAAGLAPDKLRIEDLDLNHLTAALTASQSNGRNSLAHEIRSLRHQMSRLFPPRTPPGETRPELAGPGHPDLSCLPGTGKTPCSSPI